MTAEGSGAAVDVLDAVRKICNIANAGLDSDDTCRVADEAVAKVSALLTRTAELEAERNAAVGNIHEEIAANMAFREAGGALR